MPAPIVVVDTEGSGLYPDDGARVSVISWAYRDDSGQVVSGATPFGQGPPGQLFDMPIDEGPVRWAELLDWLAGCWLVFHNASHDMQVLLAGSVTGYPGRSFVDQFHWDTSVGQRHLDPLERVGLEDSCVRRLGIAPWKQRMSPWVAKTKPPRRFDLVPWSVTEQYATEDAVNTLGLYEDQQARLDAGEGDRAILLREHDITRVLFRMEVRGLGFDAEGCAAAAKDLAKHCQLVQQELPRELQPPTPNRICSYYYDQLGYAPTKFKDGQPERSADAFSREGLAEQGAPYIDLLDKWASAETALTSWYVPWSTAVGSDSRLRMRVRQTKVTSGRFSGERVNLLAIPHDKMLEALPAEIPTVRSFIRPREGCSLWEVDLSQAEVRVGAVAAQCKPLMDAYSGGFDVYELTANDLFGVTRCHPKSIKGCESCAKFDHYRGLCKRLVLATLYAAGTKTLRVQIKKFMHIDIPEQECQEFYDAFKARYPEFGTATRKWEKFALANGYVPLALNERRYFQLYEMMCSQCRGGGCRRCNGTGKQAYKALNQRIQGSVAVVMKPCMIETDREFPGTLLLQTHDSLLLETADEAIAPKVASIMETNFTNAFGLPFETEIKRWDN